MRRSIVRLLFLFTAASSALGSVARGIERSEVPEKYTWDLRDLYPNEAAWTAAKDALVARVPGLARFQGHLGDSADSLFAALSYQMDLDRDLSRLSTYASQLYDQDTRIAKNLEKRQAAEQLVVQYRAAVAYVRPEILAVGADTVRGFVAADQRLKDYRPYLEDILRRAPHTLTPAEEKVAAQAGRFSGTGESVRGQFTNAELPYPEVKLSSGETVRLDAAAYTRYRALPTRSDRVAVFQAFWSKHREFQGTLGSALNGQIQAHLFNKDVHKFGSCLEASLFRDNIPTSVYRQLVSDVHANLGTLHRYLQLRRRMMRLDTLRYEDLYAPIIPEVDLKYTPEEAMQLTLGAVAPLGKDYVSTLKKGFDSRWTDWLPNVGKSSGAYSTGAYGVHPYQLQNFTGLYEEVSTLAHESGHSMHTYLADQTQPYVTHDYATFVAEVASTLNENLLLHYMLDRTKERETRLFLLGSYLDNLRGTLFRQTLFAEFELSIHEMAERGETLTGENLSELYLGLLRTYYGHDQGVCEIDSLYGVEWAYVDHFFYDFYVYQYATSIVASTAIVNGIRDEAAAKKPVTQRRDAYLQMLRSGSSKYPIDLLRDAGVDMTTSAPFQASMREMNAVMDQIEKLLK
jgi:oligoendopeptidase F